VAESKQLEFFLLRYVPDAVKDEFVNVGVVLLEPSGGFAGVEFARDWRRLRCLDPDADLEMLQALEAELRSKLKDAADREALLARLKDSLSGSLQLSPSKALEAESPAQELTRLAEMYLESPRRLAAVREPAARSRILRRMQAAFEHAGVWQMMRKKIAAAKYTRPGDPLVIDCGYQPNGVVKMFHALSLQSDPNAAKLLAFSFPQVAEGIARLDNAAAELTAVVENDFDRSSELVAYALDVLAQARITIATTAALPEIAERVRQELRI
jgi:hypothetical protein